MPALPSPPRSVPPQHLPADCAERYAMRGLLASGGFGAVFSAEQVALARPVAVTVLLSDALADADQLARFEAEAKITAALVHPHVVKVLDFGAATGVPWIVYELLPGRSLRPRVEGPPVELTAVLTIAWQVASALEAAHEAGVVHRDIKPENVLEASPDVYKVGDFGIARLSSQRAVQTAVGIVLGTPAYMAPEQILGGEPRPASDLYSLGVVLHELWSGHRPFDDESPVLLMERHVKSEPPQLAARRPGVPAPLEALAARLLAKRPEQRPTARQAMEALEAIGGRENVRTSILTRPPSRPARPAASGVATRPVAVPRPAPAGARRALAALAAFAVGGAMAFALRSRPEPPAASPSPSATASASALPAIAAPTAAEREALSKLLEQARVVNVLVADHYTLCDGYLRVEGSLEMVPGESRASRLIKLLPKLPADKRAQLIERTSLVRGRLLAILLALPPHPVQRQGLELMRSVQLFLSSAAGIDKDLTFSRLDDAVSRRSFPRDWMRHVLEGKLAIFRTLELPAAQHFERALAELGTPAPDGRPDIDHWQTWVYLAHTRAGCFFRDGSTTKGREAIARIEETVPPEVRGDPLIKKLLGELPGMQHRLRPR